MNLSIHSQTSMVQPLKFDWEWISNVIPDFTVHKISYPCCDSSKTIIVKGAPGVFFAGCLNSHMLKVMLDMWLFRHMAKKTAKTPYKG